MSMNPSPNPYLPSQRFFPNEPEFLQRELNNSYVDIAKSVNLREIGIYSQSLNVAGQTFEIMPGTQSQESQRKIFIITSFANPTPHGLMGFSMFTRIYGVAQTASDWRPIPYASATLITNQIELKVDFTNITIINGGTAPAITKALVVLEFI